MCFQENQQISSCVFVPFKLYLLACVVVEDMACLRREGDRHFSH